MKAKLIKIVFSIWPPFVGAGIRVKYIAADFTEAIVALNLHWYNINYVKTHFGGSLYAMTDPFYMLMLMHLLGKDYIIWDKNGSIDYISPARGTVTAHFRIDDKQVAEIKERTIAGEAFLPEYTVDINNEQGDVIAKVTKRLHIRRK